MFYLNDIISFIHFIVINSFWINILTWNISWFYFNIKFEALSFYFNNNLFNVNNNLFNVNFFYLEKISIISHSNIFFFSYSIYNLFKIINFLNFFFLTNISNFISFFFINNKFYKLFITIEIPYIINLLLFVLLINFIINIYLKKKTFVYF